MDIIVPFSIRKRELDGEVGMEAKKVFQKLKEKPELAEEISARGLPARTTLHKVYATTAGGARRLLFFCRHSPRTSAEAEKPTEPSSERWVLLFYRDKSDPVGTNMTHKNPEFVTQLEKHLRLALADIVGSTAQAPLYEQF